MSQSLRENAVRIVSLAPSVTSVLAALGMRRRLVGVSKWCADVADVRGIPSLGDCWSIDPARLRALHPTLIFGSVPFKPEALAKVLEEPATFVGTSPRTLCNVYEDIRIIARIVNRASRGESIIGKMKSALAKIRKRATRANTRPIIYCEAWPNPRISSPPWVAELVDVAGGRMAVPAGQRISDDAVAAARPDIIVLAWTATGLRAKVESVYANATWKDLPAVRHHRVFVVRDEWLNTPAPILVKGALELFRLFHPELQSVKHRK
jgi:iron complex transport system substrate-binding protein